jgi:putative endonuclease
MFFVYVLKSKVDGRLYKGMTDNLERRINEHNLGKVKSTKGYTPWDLVYQEVFDNRMDGRLREVFLKSGIGREFLKEKLTR